MWSSSWLILLACRCPMKCVSCATAARSAALAVTSCTRFSPIRVNPAASAGRIRAAGCVLVASSRRTSDGSRPAASGGFVDPRPDRAQPFEQGIVAGCRHCTDPNEPGAAPPNRPGLPPRGRSCPWSRSPRVTGFRAPRVLARMPATPARRSSRPSRRLTRICPAPAAPNRSPGSTATRPWVHHSRRVAARTHRAAWRTRRERSRTAQMKPSSGSSARARSVRSARRSSSVRRNRTSQFRASRKATVDAITPR